MVKITSMSTICVDIFESGELQPGGEALNFAAIASSYNHVQMSIIGAIGDDIYGQKALAAIGNKEIDKSCIHIVKGGATATNRISLTPSGDRYFKEGSWNGGVYQEFKFTEIDYERLRASDMVFLNYYCPLFSEVLALKETCGYKLAVDFDVVRDFDKLEQIVPNVDFFFISGDEESLPVYKKWSEKYSGIFNATLAEKGSVSYQNGKEYRVKAIPAEIVIDTTGCGDSYHAAFLCSYTYYNDIIAAMNEGSRVASETLAHKGGFSY